MLKQTKLIIPLLSLSSSITSTILSRGEPSDDGIEWLSIMSSMFTFCSLIDGNVNESLLLCVRYWSGNYHENINKFQYLY